MSNTKFFELCIVGIVSLGLLNSCDKNSTDNDVASAAEATLSIKVEGIADEVDFNSNEAKASKSQSSVASIPADGILKTKEVSFKEFDGIVRLQHDLNKAGRTVVSNDRNAKNSSGGLKALAMDPGVKYRLLLYKDGVFVTSVHATSGVASHVEVIKDVDYTWYAYSYNTSDNIPDVANTAAPVIESTIDKPLLYASGTVKVSGAGVVDKPLLVKFAHRTSRIGAELSARGMFAGLQTITAKFDRPDYVQKGTLNILTGQYENISPVDVGNLNFTSFSAATKDTIKVAYYYTAAQTPIVPMTVNVQNFTIKLDDGSNRTFSTPFQYSMNMSTMPWGYRLTNSMDLIESALFYAGQYWSRANLYFSNDDKAYRFKHFNQITTPVNEDEEFWNYASSFPKSDVNKQDPCTRVYPLNKWRMPTTDETRVLISKRESDGRLITGDYVEYSTDGIAAPYPDNKVRILKTGYMMAIAGRVEFKTNGYFWTLEPTILGGIFGSSESYRVSDNTQFGILGGDKVWLHGLQSTLGGRETVRCIRK